MQYTIKQMIAALEKAGYVLRQQPVFISYPSHANPSGFGNMTLHAWLVFKDGQQLLHDWTNRSMYDSQLKEVFAREYNERLLKMLF